MATAGKPSFSSDVIVFAVAGFSLVGLVAATAGLGFYLFFRNAPAPPPPAEGAPAQESRENRPTVAPPHTATGSSQSAEPEPTAEPRKGDTVPVPLTIDQQVLIAEEEGDAVELQRLLRESYAIPGKRGRALQNHLKAAHRRAAEEALAREIDAARQTIAEATANGDTNALETLADGLSPAAGRHLGRELADARQTVGDQEHLKAIAAIAGQFRANRDVDAANAALQEYARTMRRPGQAAREAVGTLNREIGQYRRARDTLEQAEAAHHNGHFPNAISLLDRADEYSPDIKVRTAPLRRRIEEIQAKYARLTLAEAEALAEQGKIGHAIGLLQRQQHKLGKLTAITERIDHYPNRQKVERLGKTIQRLAEAGDHDRIVTEADRLDLTDAPEDLKCRIHRSRYAVAKRTIRLALLDVDAGQVDAAAAALKAVAAQIPETIAPPEAIRKAGEALDRRRQFIRAIADLRTKASPIKLELDRHRAAGEHQQALVSARALATLCGDTLDCTLLGRMLECAALVAETDAAENPDILTGALLCVPLQFDTVAEALQNAAPGDRVIVAPGHYRAGFTLKSGVALIGSGQRTTILDAAGRGRVVDASETIRATIAGFTLTGGQAGDGAAVFGQNPSSLRITDNTIRDNTATSNGGAMFIAGGTAIILRNRILENRATFGAGILPLRADAIIACNLIARNHTTRGGSAIRNYGTAKVFFNTIVANTSDGYAGGIDTFGDHDNITVRNCILWHNQPHSNAPRSHCLSDEKNDASREHIVTAAARFVAPERDDYRLRPDSPARDAGIADIAPMPLLDLNGNPRLVGRAPDLGACEIQNTEKPLFPASLPAARRRPYALALLAQHRYDDALRALRAQP